MDELYWYATDSSDDETTFVRGLASPGECGLAMGVVAKRGY